MTTIGMNYEILLGKENAFEKKFALVMGVMETVPGHVRTNLYRDAFREREYLVVSEWERPSQFEEFIRSDTFRATTAWGEANILASRPSHFVYGGESRESIGGDCPSHRAQPA